MEENLLGCKAMVFASHFPRNWQPENKTGKERVDRGEEMENEPGEKGEGFPAALRTGSSGSPGEPWITPDGCCAQTRSSGSADKITL